MSHGGRAFQDHGYSAMSPNTFDIQAQQHSFFKQRQQQAFAQHQQVAAVMAATSASSSAPVSTYSPSANHNGDNPTLSNAAAAAAAAAAVAVGGASNGGGGGNNNSSNPRRSITMPPAAAAAAPPDSLYCESCRVFRHVSYFQDERGVKYSVCHYCRLSHRDQLQKRKQPPLEQQRYDLYDERSFKQARHSQQRLVPPPTPHHHRQQQQQPFCSLPPHSIQAQAQQQQQQQQLHTPSTVGIHQQHVKTSPPSQPSSIMLPQVDKSQLFSATTMHSQSKMQSHVQQQTQVMQPSPVMSLPLPIPQQQQQAQDQQLQHMHMHLHLPPATLSPQTPSPSVPFPHNDLKAQLSRQQQQQQQQAALPGMSGAGRPVVDPPQSGIIQQSGGTSIAAAAAAAVVASSTMAQTSTTTTSSSVAAAAAAASNGHQQRPGTGNRSESSSSSNNKGGGSTTTSSSSGNRPADVLSLDEFAHALQQETEFDRKQYDVDITPLIERMGENAVFSQLGRGVCEYVLTGTKFNFSLKDQRRSIKTPDTLSTLRYYCSQRADTAKPRKANDHPKATNRYDCAGALTIIIDLSKKTAHVTLIHKHAHPPFVPHHHHHYHNNHHQQSAAASSSSSNSAYQQRLMKQRQAKQVEKQFEALRQKVADFGRLLESQQQYKNKDFVQTAMEAFSNANEMLAACQSVDRMASAGTMDQAAVANNKYTMHYNKKGDL